MRMSHDPHPLVPPITSEQFRREMKAVWARSGSPWRGRIEFSDRLDARHARCSRDYAEVELRYPLATRDGRPMPVYRFARAALALPVEHRIGLMAHECGHVASWETGTERAADLAAWRVFGVKIAYDMRWPSRGSRRGLQYAKEIK